VGRKSLARERKSEILDHFYQVLAEEGLEGASLAKIADRMGVYPSHIAHYFKTKQDLVNALVVRILTGFVREVSPKWRSVESPGERLARMLGLFFSPEEMGLIDRRVFYACFYLSLSHDTIHRNYQELYDNLARLLRGPVETCLAGGKTGGVDAGTVVDMIIAVMSGLVMNQQILNDSPRLAAAGRLAKETVLGLLHCAEAGSSDRSGQGENHD